MKPPAPAVDPAAAELLTRIGITLLACLMSTVLTACDASDAYVMQPSEEAAATPTTAAQAGPTGTFDVSPTSGSQASPVATPLPPYTHALQTVRWPQEGDLLSSISEDATLTSAIGDLESGQYMILMDSGAGVISAVSLSTQASRILLAPPPQEYSGAQLATSERVHAIFLRVFPRSWLIYDLDGARTLELGETCSGTPPHRASPDGSWIAGICEDFIQLPEASTDHVVLEVVSTGQGEGTRVAIPRSPDQRNRPLLAWLDGQHLLISNVWIDQSLMACVMRLEEAVIFCPPLELRGMVAYDTDASVGSPLIPFVDFQAPPRAVLVARECFALDGSCPSVKELQIDRPVILVTTTDPAIIWWIEPLGPDPTTEIGRVDLSTGDLHQVASLGGDYVYKAACPDGSCIFIYDRNGDQTWRLNLDGGLQLIPIRGDAILGAFRVP